MTTDDRQRDSSGSDSGEPRTDNPKIGGPPDEQAGSYFGPANEPEEGPSEVAKDKAAEGAEEDNA